MAFQLPHCKHGLANLRTIVKEESLPSSTEESYEEAARNSEQAEAIDWSQRRTPVTKIRMEVDIEEDRTETNLDELTCEGEDAKRHCLDRGTSECCHIGASCLKLMWKQLKDKPRGAFEYDCGQAFAMIDCSRSIPANCVVITHNGKFLEGPVLVYRYPIMKGDTDLQVFNAIEPPGGLPNIARNGVMFSLLDWGVTRLSGWVNFNEASMCWREQIP